MYYLLFLDPNGIHLYVFLSPRTNKCVGVTFAIYGLLILFYKILGGSFQWIVLID